MGALPYRLREHRIGGGQVSPRGPIGFRLELPPIRSGYGDAQVDDCQGLPRRRFHWRPPLSLRLRARASHPDPPGTLGFGFWNDPLGLSVGGVRRLPAAPQAAWFFHAGPPNDFTFVRGGAGAGWKAAALRAPPLPPPLLIPGAGLAYLAGRIPGLRPIVARAAWSLVRAAEAPLDVALDEWHEYRLLWQPTQVQFLVDGRRRLSAAVPPRGPLGFVAWVDNQYAVLSEQAGIRFGIVPTSTAAQLEIAELEILAPTEA